MKRKIRSVVLMFIVIPALNMPLTVNDDRAENKPKRIVVIELFTSQGCNSCPDAEGYLDNLAFKRQYKLDELIVLKYHVSMWDHLGWKDTLALKACSDRQSEYWKLFKAENKGTPELYLNGEHRYFGGMESFDEKLKNALESQPELLLNPIVIINPVKASINVEMNTITTVDKKDSKLKRINIYSAIFENGLEAKITAGENSGRTLKQNQIVRAFGERAKLDFGKKQSVKSRFSIQINKEWNLEKSGIVILAQNPESGQILQSWGSYLKEIEGFKELNNADKKTGRN
ncbi:MAG: DUF1223 domain-containing protein [Planctomycetes bacterium]|nr:DUF1223 domain-containing protein [Planctomycetota bacterium]